MTSYQDAVIAEFTKYAERNGCVVLTEYRFSNVGRLLIGSVTEVKVTIDFNFQSGGHNRLTIKGTELDGTPARASFTFQAENTDRLRAAVLMLRELLDDKLIEEKDR